jgi:hypothetical protein
MALEATAGRPHQFLTQTALAERLGYLVGVAAKLADLTLDRLTPYLSKERMELRGAAGELVIDLGKLMNDLRPNPAYGHEQRREPEQDQGTDAEYVLEEDG